MQSSYLHMYKFQSKLANFNQYTMNLNKITMHTGYRHSIWLSFCAQHDMLFMAQIACYTNMRRFLTSVKQFVSCGTGSCSTGRELCLQFLAVYINRCGKDSTCRVDGKKSVWIKMYKMTQLANSFCACLLWWEQLSGFFFIPASSV